MTDLKATFKPKQVKLRGGKGDKYKVSAIALSSNCRYGVFGSKWSSPESTGWQEVVNLIDIESGEMIYQFEVNGEQINCVAITPDLRYVFSSGFGGNFMWDINNGKEVNRLNEIERILKIEFSPDGQFALIDSVTERGLVRLLDFQNWREIGRFVGHLTQAYCFTFSPDGESVLTGGHDKTIRLWDIKSGKELLQYNGHRKEIFSLKFSKSGEFFISGSVDKTIRLWNVKTGQEIRKFEGHTNAVRDLSFSPDNQNIISCGNDRTVRLWEIDSGKEVNNFTGHTDYVSVVKFSPDGKYALSGSYDRTIRVWEI